eukprot:41203-Pelagomonas_calceolata.AAC.3
MSRLTALPLHRQYTNLLGGGDGLRLGEGERRRTGGGDGKRRGGEAAARLLPSPPRPLLLNGSRSEPLRGGLRGMR